jgi:fatty-acyl-CoA synthase
MLGLRCADAVMPIVPMFHANAWCIPFVAPMQGAKLVLAGSKLDPESLCELFRTEAVTLAAGVPTIWLGFLAHLKEKGTPLPHLRRVLTGGAAPALSMIEAFERDLGIEVIQGWGMTEMSPMGTYSALKPGMETLPQTARAQIKIKQGRVPFGVEMTVRDEAGAEKPWDGKAFGHLKVRGCAVIAHYFREEQKQILDEEGWFDTGDIATIDAHGFMQITDRAKDVIKSGGEWISSIEIENLAMAHPDVAEAAVIGIAHPKWNERPLLVIVKKPGKNPDRAGILGFLDGRIAKWWMPDDVAFLAEMPHTATGKVQKTALREIFKDYVLPAA